MIKKSTIFDRNIKSEIYISVNIQFEKNITFNEKVKIDEKVKFDKKIKIDKNIKFEKKIKYEKNIKFEKDVKFQIYPTPPLPPPILWIWCLIFAGPKRNSEKPKVGSFDFGIVAIVIWTLSWQLEENISHVMQQAVHNPNNFFQFIFSTKVFFTFLQQCLRVVRIAPPSLAASKVSPPI